MAKSYPNNPRPSRVSSQRPFSVTLLAIGVLTLTVLNGVRAWQSWENWDFLAEFQIVSPLYQLISGLFWASLGLVLFWGLWVGKPWVPYLAGIAAIGYALYYWADRLLLALPLGHFAYWPFAAVFTGLMLFLVFIIVNRRSARLHFSENRKK